MSQTQLLLDNLPFLVPLLIVQVGLMVAALVHVLRHDHYRVGNRVLWVLVVLFISIIGPICYFAFGREAQA